MKYYILLLFVALIAISLPIISFSQHDYPVYPKITTQQIPLVEKQLQSQTGGGYLILATIIINDNGGTKHASDFTINIVGNTFIVGSFRALPSPEIKVVSIQEGNYSMSISNTQGYQVSQKNQCEGNIKSGEVKTCLITIDDEPSSPPPPTEEEKPIKPVLVVASAQDLGKEAPKAADGDFESRWSGNGKGQFIEFTFNKAYKITKVALTGYWYHKMYLFEINGKSFENPAGRQPGQLIEYDLKDLNINSNKVRIVGQGNNSTDYNSYREIVFYTSDKVI